MLPSLHDTLRRVPNLQTRGHRQFVTVQKQGQFPIQMSEGQVPSIASNAHLPPSNAAYCGPNRHPSTKQRTRPLQLRWGGKPVQVSPGRPGSPQHAQRSGPPAEQSVAHLTPGTAGHPANRHPWQAAHSSLEPTGPHGLTRFPRSRSGGQLRTRQNTSAS